MRFFPFRPLLCVHCSHLIRTLFTVERPFLSRLLPRLRLFFFHFSFELGCLVSCAHIALSSLPPNKYEKKKRIFRIFSLISSSRCKLETSRGKCPFAHFVCAVLRCTNLDSFFLFAVAVPAVGWHLSGIAMYARKRTNPDVFATMQATTFTATASHTDTE